jgi:hypothetical protein
VARRFVDIETICRRSHANRSALVCGTSLDFAGNYFFRLLPQLDWIERNTCALSDSRGDLAFCSTLVCPADVRLLGYPWVLLPDGTDSVFGTHGFSPVAVTQWPPPGLPLWRGTTTNVTMTALDSSGREAECRWEVTVAPLVQLGTLRLDLPALPNGTYTRTSPFLRDKNVLIGQIFKLKGQTSDHLRGSGSRLISRLYDGSNKQTGRELLITNERNKSSINVPRVPVAFSIFNESDVHLSTQVEQNAAPNQATYVVYGQVQQYT